MESTKQIFEAMCQNSVLNATRKLAFLACALICSLSYQGERYCFVFIETCEL